MTDLALGGPAASSNVLQRGDIIAVIGGKNVRGMSVLQARDLIMGPEGSSVVLGVHRESRGAQNGAAPGEFFEVALTRASHIPASRDASLNRSRGYSQSPAVQNLTQRPSASPMVQYGRVKQVEVLTRKNAQRSACSHVEMPEEVLTSRNARRSVCSHVGMLSRNLYTVIS